MPDAVLPARQRHPSHPSMRYRLCDRLLQRLVNGWCAAVRTGRGQASIHFCPAPIGPDGSRNAPPAAAHPNGRGNVPNADAFFCKARQKKNTEEAKGLSIIGMDSSATYFSHIFTEREK